MTRISIMAAALCACTSVPGAPAVSSFRDCRACPEMVVVPAGAFLMGSPANEVGRFDDEGPRHSVSIARPFAVSRAPVTRAQFEAFVRASGHKVSPGCMRMSDEGEWRLGPDLGWRTPGFEQGGNHPVVCVSWDDAHAYATWLSAESGVRYRLLSEAEFEYAARAGSQSRFAWPDEDEVCAHANGFDLAAKRVHPDWPALACDDGAAYTSPVASFPANAFGLFDMTGNVFQWTQDCFVDGGYAGVPADGTARETDACRLRVIRGGSWLNGARGLRAAMRDRDPQDGRYGNIGIRVARDLAP